MERPADPGLQPERVALSWQRTALAIAVGALIYARIVFQTIGYWAFVPMVAGLVLALYLGAGSRVRYRRQHRAMTDENVRLTDGKLLAVVSASVSAAGVFALVAGLLGA